MFHVLQNIPRTSGNTPSIMFFSLAHVRLGNGAEQDGTASHDEWEGAGAGINGTSAILVGYTTGAWSGTREGGTLDFVAIELDADGAPLWVYQVSVKFTRPIGCLFGRMGSQQIQGSNLRDMTNATWCFFSEMLDPLFVSVTANYLHLQQAV